MVYDDTEPDELVTDGLEFESTNEQVATVDSNGKLKIVGLGRARINAMAYSKYATGINGKAYDSFYINAIEDLVEFKINNKYDSKVINEESKIGIDLNITGINLDFATVIIRNKESYNNSALLSIKKDGNYLSFKNTLKNNTTGFNLIDGTYYISDLYINPSSENYIHYCVNPKSENDRKLDFYNEFEIKLDNQKSDDFVEVEPVAAAMQKIELKNSNAKQNEKVYVDFETQDFVASQVMLSFTDNENGKNFIVYLKDLNSNPYFIILFTTEKGIYELNYAIIKDLDGNKIQYRKGKAISSIKHFDFNSILTVEENILDEVDILNLDNEKVTADIIQKISKLEGNITVELNAIFNGKNIVNPKTIDVSVQTPNELDGITGVKSGMVVEFAENGALPGKCLIRVLNKTEIFKNEKVNVYYFNEGNGLFDGIAYSVTKTEDGYYEFYIDHNSKYILTTEKIAGKYVNANSSEIISGNSSNSSDSNTSTFMGMEINTTLYIIIAGFVLALFAFIFGLINMFKKK